MPSIGPVDSGLIQKDDYKVRCIATSGAPDHIGPRMFSYPLDRKVSIVMRVVSLFPALRWRQDMRSSLLRIIHFT